MTNLIGKLLCKLKLHRWLRMGFHEAYPARGGVKCARCKFYRLFW